VFESRRPGTGDHSLTIGVEDLRLAVSGQRFVQRLDAEPGVHGVRQPPRKDMARRPVHDRDQVQEAALDRDVGDVGAPDLIGPVDREPLEQIGINPMRRARHTGSEERWSNPTGRPNP